MKISRKLFVENGRKGGKARWDHLSKEERSKAMSAIRMAGVKNQQARLKAIREESE